MDWLFKILRAYSQIKPCKKSSKSVNGYAEKIVCAALLSGLFLFSFQNGVKSSLS
jgi:hypothetical protein